MTRHKSRGVRLLLGVTMTLSVVSQLQYLILLVLVVHDRRVASSQELYCDGVKGAIEVVGADTCIVDIVEGDPTTREMVEMLRYEYEDYPSECRPGKDLCPEQSSWSNQRKGDITWPTTLIGSRRAVRCQYAYIDAVYVSRDCVADVNSTSETWAVWSEWDDSNIDVTCPDPPFTIATQSLYDSLVNETSLFESGLCESVIRSLVDLISLRTRYPRDPLFDTDHQQLRSVSVRWMADCHVVERTSNSSWRQLEVSSLLTVTDLVLFNSSVQYLWTTDSYAAYVESMMRLLESRVVASVDRPERLQFHGSTFSAFAESSAASEGSMTSNGSQTQYRIESSNLLGALLVDISERSPTSIQLILLHNYQFLWENVVQWKQQQQLKPTRDGVVQVTPRGY